MAYSKLFQAFYNHPAGPKTIFFWAPTFKWGLNIANVVDISARPPETVSYPQQTALACSGLIWAKYSTVITPKNWNLFSVSIGMLAIASYQLSRKFQHESVKKQLLQKDIEEINS